MAYANLFQVVLASVGDLLIWLIGAEQDISELTIIQMITRTIIVYGIALILIRIGKRRFLGGFSAFDILMGFVIGSIMSRTITGRENLFSATIVILTLMLLHYSISYITYYYRDVSKVVKNTERKLVDQGEVDEAAMEQSKLGKNDLLQAIRKQGRAEGPEDIHAAYLERDGSITIIPKARKPRIVEIEIEDGVKRVELSIG